MIFSKLRLPRLSFFWIGSLSLFCFLLPALAQEGGTTNLEENEFEDLEILDSPDSEDPFSDIDFPDDVDSKEGDIVDSDFTAEPTDEEPSWEIQTTVAFKWGYNLDRLAGLSMARLEFDQSLEYQYSPFRVYVSYFGFTEQIYNLRPKNYSPRPTVGEVELREAYFQGNFNFLDITLGNQIVTWGKSDLIPTIDMINPIDNRWPGSSEIKNLKLPKLLLKLDLYFGEWQLSMIGGYKNVFPRFPEYGGGYITRPLPSFSVDEYGLQGGASLEGRLSAFDLAFYGGHFYQDHASVEDSTMGPPQLTFEKMNLASVAISAPISDFLLKGQFAFFHDVSYTSALDKKNLLQFYLGLEMFSGIVNLELANTTVLDYQEALQDHMLGIFENTVSLGLRISKGFLNDTLWLNFAGSVSGEKVVDSGGMLRGWSSYDYNDNTSFEVGYIEYIGGKNDFLEMMSRNDHFFFNIILNI